MHRALSARRAFHTSATRFQASVVESSVQDPRGVIQALNPRVNALVHTILFPATSGLTVAVKDNICTRDMPTTCSSAMLSEFTSPIDATVVRKLRARGAVIVGKANCDEFGMGSLNIHSIHGPVVNPFGLSSGSLHAAGGSSGGSAAAVAAGMCDTALGTDTGGSVRLPASYCGVVGFKPSYGLVSRWGVVSYADSLDCVGVFGRSVKAARTLFDMVDGHDPRDPTSASPSTRATARATTHSRLQELGGLEGESLAGLRIGIPQEYFPRELHTHTLVPIRRVLRSLAARGAVLVPLSLPTTRLALPAYYVLASAEASSNLARYDGIQYGFRAAAEDGAGLKKSYAMTRTAGFGKEVQKRILLGTYALSAEAYDNYFLAAQRVRTLVRRDFDRIFTLPNVHSPSPVTNGVDVLIHPSAMRTAPPLNEAPKADNSLDAYTQDTLTTPASLAKLPALSVPAGLGQDGWPVGVSVVGQWGSEDLVWAVGSVVEAAAARAV